MLYKELEKKNANELEKMLGEERGKLYDLRLKITVGQLKDVRSIRVVRGNIARILTKLRTARDVQKVTSKASE